MFLLDNLHEELNTGKPDRPLPASGTSGTSTSSSGVDALVAMGDRVWREHVHSNASHVARLFHGLQLTTTECHTCRTPSYRFEPFMLLSVPLPRTPAAGRLHLHHCIEAYLSKELLQGIGPLNLLHLRFGPLNLLHYSAH